MNSRSITDYILKLEKRNEQLKELYRKSEEERVATLEKLNSKLLDESIQRVGAGMSTRVRHMITPLRSSTDFHSR
jgi:hypothetical protein